MNNKQIRELYYKQYAKRHFPKKRKLQLVINKKNKRELKNMKEEIKFYAKWLAYKKDE